MEKKKWREPVRLLVSRETQEQFFRERIDTSAKIAALMKEYREKSGLSVREAAKRAGCKHSLLFAYESGDRKTSDVFDVLVFCRVFGVSFQKFAKDLGV